jgi:hypothetical protein
MGLHFTAPDRATALRFLQTLYPSKNVRDQPESAGPLLDLIDSDVVRIQDPTMHGPKVAVIPGPNWKEDLRSSVTEICARFHGEATHPHH